MAVYAIGDVQGCLEPLQRLLDKLRFDPAADHLWFCGDLVNRGGQSLEVLRLIKSLDIHSHVVLGNHDLSLLAISMRREDEQRKVNAELQRVLFAEDREELLDWLRKRPLMHVDAARGWAMVHAGLAPKWTIRLARQRAHEVEARLHSPDYRKLLRGMFGNQPDTWSPKLNGVDRMRAIINVFTRMRFCSPKGTIAFDAKGRPGTQKPGLYPWFDVPGHAQRELRIVCGHWSTLGLSMTNQVFSIDTGCVWGGPLTALQLDAEWPRVIQVLGKAGAKPGLVED